MEAGSIWVTIGAKVDDLVNGVNTSKAKLSELQGEVTGVNRNMNTWGQDMKTLSIPLAAVSTATYLAVEKFGGMAQDLKDLSLQTGITTDKLQDLNYAALISNTSISSLSLALNTMTRVMGDAADEASPAYKAFMGLGIDPHGRTPDEVFDDLAIALTNIKDPAEKAAAMQDIFGKNYRDMIPYLETYVTKQEEIHKSAKWTPEELQSMEDAKLGWDKMTGALTIYSGKFMALVNDVQTNMNKLNPIYQLTNAGGVDVGASATNLANIATAGQYGKLQTAMNGGSAITQNITINNPSGTTAEQLAFIERANREIARLINMGVL